MRNKIPYHVLAALALWGAGADAARGDISCTVFETANPAHVFAQIDHGADAPECRVAKGTGGVTISYCAVAFDYRADDATAVFDRVATALAACMAEVTDTGAGQVVNHPDSFAQKQFAKGGVEWSLSLKDKGGLEQTLIFLRAETVGD